MLQFLEAEKHKYVYIINLTSYWYSCPYNTIFINKKIKKTGISSLIGSGIAAPVTRCNFHNRKSKNTYIKSV